MIWRGADYVIFTGPPLRYIVVRDNRYYFDNTLKELK
jgi:hypothetical protein